MSYHVLICVLVSVCKCIFFVFSSFIFSGDVFVSYLYPKFRLCFVSMQIAIKLHFRQLYVV